MVLSGYIPPQTACPAGMNLLSCGWDNFQTQTQSAYRYAMPISSTTCQCSDVDAKCVAWCTTLPVGDFEIVSASGAGDIYASCSPGNRALGCTLSSTTSNVEPYKGMNPTADGSQCYCYEYNGGICYATCAYINNYEIVIVIGHTATTTATCQSPGNVVLGCGSYAYGTTTASDPFRYNRVQQSSNTSCLCYDSYGTKCYAMCGQLWWTVQLLNIQWSNFWSETFTLWRICKEMLEAFPLYPFLTCRGEFYKFFL